MFTLTLVDIE